MYSSSKKEIGYISFYFDNFTNIVSFGKTEIYTATENNLATAIEKMIYQIQKKESIENAFLVINIDMKYIKAETVDDIVAKCREVNELEFLQTCCKKTFIVIQYA